MLKLKLALETHFAVIIFMIDWNEKRREKEILRNKSNTSVMVTNCEFNTSLLYERAFSKNYVWTIYSFLGLYLGQWYHAMIWGFIGVMKFSASSWIFIKFYFHWYFELISEWIFSPSSLSLMCSGSKRKVLYKTSTICILYWHTHNSRTENMCGI